MNSRKEFTAKTKKAAWERANGMCEGVITTVIGNMDIGFRYERRRCKFPIDVGTFHYDHFIPEGLSGGDNSLANCQVLCVHCHTAKTVRHDIKAIAKAKRIAKRLSGLKKSRNPLPFGKDSKWRKKVGGRVVLRRQSI
jgi:5-methylcytosine-specific restriction protein A